ncbi:MAG: Excinuclease ABC subunit C [Parcubacteria group bacterium GW2011_GWF2_39_13b]|nr:MAG: Excinuclease ABC subunit C [Parcubacteria group bacterium GW2011_GWF2_39_13b]
MAGRPKNLERRMKKQYYVYIAANKNNTVLYTGITNNLFKRAFEHKNKLTAGFSSRYNINKIIYYEIFNNPKEAILAEKRIKGWTRKKKIDLIKSKNLEFKDLLDFECRDSSPAKRGQNDKLFNF